MIDADLGGGMIKQRIARAGQGRSGGYRMLVGVCWADRAVFVFGFAKSDLANIGEKQLATIRDIAAIWLKADEEALALAAAAGQLTEVHHDG